MTQSTAQAVTDARKAADYMNAAAPGSPAAQQATRTYLETKRLAAMANATHDPNIARQAVQASQASVSHANNVATGRSPNAYSPYNSNGNPYSYHNSSYQTGKDPSPDAPRIEDVTGEDVYYCNTESILKRYVKDSLELELLSITEKMLLLQQFGKILFKQGTLSVGGTISGEAGVRGSVSGGVIADLEGNIAFIDSVGGGVGMVSTSAGAYVTTTNAPNINTFLNSRSLQVGGSLFVVGGDVIILQDTESGEVYGGMSGSFTPLTITPAIPVEMHTEVVQYTISSKSINVFKLLMDAVLAVERW